MATPDYELMFDAAVTILRTIKIASGYINNIEDEQVGRRIVSLDYAVDQNMGLPYIFVTRGAENEQRNNERGMISPKAYQANLPLLVVAYLRTDQSDGEVPDTVANNFLNDVQKAFVAQFTTLQAVRAVNISFLRGPTVTHGWDPEGVVYTEIFMPIVITYFMPFGGY